MNNFFFIIISLSLSIMPSNAEYLVLFHSLTYSHRRILSFAFILDKIWATSFPSSSFAIDDVVIVCKSDVNHFNVYIEQMYILCSNPLLAVAESELKIKYKYIQIQYMRIFFSLFLSLYRSIVLCVCIDFPLVLDFTNIELMVIAMSRLKVDPCTDPKQKLVGRFF